MDRPHDLSIYRALEDGKDDQDTGLFMLIDGMTAITAGYRSGRKGEMVIKMAADLLYDEETP